MHFRSLVSLAVPLLLSPLGFSQATPDYKPRNFSLGSIGTVTISWTDEGVPEVCGTTDEAAFYGWGYAQAVDRYFQMELARRVMRGTQSELLGNAPRGVKNISPYDNDLTARRHRYVEFAQIALDQIDQNHGDAYSLIDQFAQGINRYLTDEIGKYSTWATLSDARFRDELADIDGMFALNPLHAEHLSLWDPLDVVLSHWRINELPSDNLNTPLYFQQRYDELRDAPNSDHASSVFGSLGATVIDEAAMTVQESDVLDNAAHYADLMAYAGANGWGPLGATAPPLVVHPGDPHPSFSHGAVLGGTRTTTGRAALLGMPQLRADKKLIEMSIKGATFSARGISFPGTPGFMVGFNDDVAWTVTSAGATVKAVVGLKKSETLADHYQFGGTDYPISSLPTTIRFRDSSLPVDDVNAWQSTTEQIEWASAVHHTDASDLLYGEQPGVMDQTTRLGIPIFTDLQAAALADPTLEYGLLAPRFFDNREDSLVAVIDMLTSSDIYEFQQAMDQYVSPSVTLMAGDKDGNIGYWFVRRTLLHSPDLAVAPLGALGVQLCLSPDDLPSDVIPMRFQPWVINPKNVLEGQTESNLEGIILSGNSGAVGAWYPLPAYSGTGDTLRSGRLRELLSSRLPSELWTPKELLGMHYDDVNSTLVGLIRAGLQLADEPVPMLSSEATSFLARLQDPNNWLFNRSWIVRGGHMHSEDPLINAIAYIGTALRTWDKQFNPIYPALTTKFGQVESGRLQIYRHIIERLGPNDSIRDDLTPEQADELCQFVDESLATAEVRAVFGYNTINDQTVKYDPYGPDDSTWHTEYLDRDQVTSENSDGIAIKWTSGAKYKPLFLADFNRYGSLNPAEDIVSPVLHNPDSAISNQADNFYAQWVSFEWHDAGSGAGVSPTELPYTIFNPGNSLHPTSPYYDNNTHMWVRDGLNFNLTDAQLNPTQWFHPAPLQ